MAKATDRRKAKRVALFDDFHVLDAETGGLLGYIRDISSQGMRIVGTVAPIIDREYRIAILPPEPIVGQTIIQLEATCRWHTTDVQRGLHSSGFQFGELPQVENHLIEQIQIEYEFSVSECGL